jgi:TonB-linked outer membrane protein, SusC/RagA family
MKRTHYFFVLFNFLVTGVFGGERMTAVFLQQLSVNGTVRNNQGTPLDGVTVNIKDANTGTATDAQGRFVLENVSADAILVFSSVGYKDLEMGIAGRSAVDVVMEEDMAGLDEVIVVGYGVAKKSDLTGAVARISMEDRILQANTNISQALTGVAGVNIQANGGANSNPSFSIRGQTSLSASGTPLIVVDGIIYNGTLSSINMNDVENIDILKDASAAAVYGSRSANGVVLITTKAGKHQKSAVSVDAYTGFQDMTNNPMRVMNAEEFALRALDWYWQQDVYNWYKTNPTNAEGRPARPDVNDRETVASFLPTHEEQQNYLQGNEINWVDEVLRIAPMQNYSLSVQGGADKTTYYISGSHSNVSGIQLNDQFKRYTVRSNLESKVNNWLTIGLNATYAFQDNSGLSASLANARVASPLVNNKIGQPDYDIYLGGELFQPYPLVNLEVINQDVRNELFAIGRAVIDVPWVKGLRYELNYSQTNVSTESNSFHSSRTPQGSDNRGYAIKSPAERRDWIVNNIVSFVRDFGDHQINSTLLFSRERIRGSSSTLEAEGFNNEVLGFNDMGIAEVATVGSAAYEENSLAYMARVNYTYRSRYLLTGTVRKDGYSGFGQDNKWAIFPSVSLGWVLSEEPFMDEAGLYLKLRTSYGVNGNQGIGRYSSLSSMGTSYYVYEGNTAIGLYPSTLGNPDLSWEETASFNMGADFGILNNRITGALNAYTARTDNVLVQRQLPPTAGYGNVWANLGGLKSKGLELEVKSINFEGNFNWTSAVVFSINRDQITRLYGAGNDADIGNSWFVGKPIDAIYDYQMAGGVWTEEEFFNGQVLPGWYPGQFRYVDQNGDRNIDPDNDRTIVGYRSPNYRFSVENSLSYKNFTLSVFVNSIQGGNGYYLADNAEMVNPLYYMQQRRNNSAINRYWSPEAPTTNTTGIYNNPLRQSGIYQSRSFVRLQDVSLAYRFGQNLLDRIKLKSCQVYVSSKNPYVWTNWQGWDPEIGVSDTPLMRNLIVGLRLSL